MDAPNLDLELQTLIARGERRRAATLLVERYASDVFALCRAMVRDATLAEDLSQDAFGRAIAGLDGYRGEASPRTWLLKIARNRCLDHLAQKKREPWDAREELEPDDHASEALAPVDLLMNRQDADRALAALAETERAIIVLHFGHGVGYPELAEAFGLREGALRMRVSRALSRMREELEPVQAPRASAAYAPPPAARSPAAGDGAAPKRRRGLGRVLDELGRVLGGAPPAPVPPAWRSAPSGSAPSAPPAPSSAKVPSLPQAPAARVPTTGAPVAGPRAPGAPPPSMAARAAAELTVLREAAPSSLVSRLRALADAI